MDKIARLTDAQAIDFYLLEAAERTERMKKEMKQNSPTDPFTMHSEDPSIGNSGRLPDREAAIAIMTEFGMDPKQAAADYDKAVRRG